MTRVEPPFGIFESAFVGLCRDKSAGRQNGFAGIEDLQKRLNRTGWSERLEAGDLVLSPLRQSRLVGLFIQL
jgi:hypothetical protein